MRFVPQKRNGPGQQGKKAGWKRTWDGDGAEAGAAFWDVFFFG